MYSSFGHLLHLHYRQNEYSPTIVSWSLVLVWACYKGCPFLILVLWIFVILPHQKNKGSWNVLWPKFLHKKRSHTKIQYALLDMVVCPKWRKHGRNKLWVRDHTSSFDGSRSRNLYLTVDFHRTQTSKCFGSNGPKLPCIRSTATDARAYPILESEYHWAVRWRVRSDDIQGLRGTHQTAWLSQH